jgi:hypothetical protein
MKNQFWSRITLENKWLVIIFFLISVQSLAQDSTIRYFYSLDSKTPLSYLRVVPSEGNQAFFTDLKGKLEIPNSELAPIKGFNISGYGINDTLISKRDLLSKETIYLKTKEYILPEFAVKSSQLIEIKIGDSRAGLWDVNNPMKLIGGGEGELYRYAIRVKIPDRSTVYLDEIKFYVSKILAEGVDISIRTLVPSTTKKIVPGRMNPISEFRELLQGNKIVKVTKSGWQQVNFDEIIQIPKGVSDLMIIFDLLEKEPKSNFAIANQKTSKKIDLGFYLTGGKIGVHSLDPVHPAVEVTLLKSK